MANLPSADISAMRNRLLNDTLGWVCIAGSIGASISLTRALYIGWKPLMALHIAIIAMLWTTWWARDKISYSTRAFILLGTIWLTAFAGVLQLGPAATAGFSVILLGFVAVLFLSTRTAIWLITVNTLCFALLGTAASLHWIEFDLDYSTYSHLPIAWVQTVWGMTSYSVIFAMVGWRMSQELMEHAMTAQNLATIQHKIASNVPGVIYQFLLRRDGSSCFPYYSEGALRVLGLDAEKLKESSTFVFDLIHPDDLANVKRTIESSARNLSTIQESFRIRHPQTGIRWVERNSTPERLPNGDTLWHGYLKDITDVRLAEQRLSATLENTPNVAVQWYDATGKILYWNQASEKFYGWAADEALGKTLDQLIYTKAQADAFLLSLQQISDTHKLTELTECHIVNRSGQERIISTSVFSIPGELTPIFVCMDIDVTEHRQAEQALRTSEAQFRMLLDSSPLPILVKGADEKIVILNQRFTEIFGYALQDISDISQWWALAYPDSDYRKSLAHEWTQGLRVATETHSVFTLESSVTCADGSVRLVESKASVTSDFAVIVYSDLTQKRIAENELIRAMETAEHANRAKSTFLANMSHELRTPLNSIIGFAQMLDMGIPVAVDPSQKQAVSYILGSSRHLYNLINDILDLARIESGKLEISRTVMSLDSVINESIALIETAANNRNIKLKHSHPHDKFIYADAVRVRQILLNFLSNAVKYNRLGGSITITCEEKGRSIRLTISDTGHGIPYAQHALLFKPFQRLGAEHTSIEGTGIGLVICKRLAEAMDGSVGFNSIEGVGSHFWLELPTSLPDQKSATIEKVSNVEISRDVSTTGRVLYIEDNLVNVSVMQHIFIQLPNVELQTADTAEIGLAMMQQNPPNLVLMDINLPGMSGMEALQKIRANPLTAHIRVIAVSAAALPHEVLAGINAGFLDYLTKPFDMTELIRLVKESLK
ncbi:MAG: PAS domain S-box protein [Sideroxydans sp.]|nr:PAS domain S-box protein [Sideroxydans sp.]